MDVHGGLGQHGSVDCLKWNRRPGLVAACDLDSLVVEHAHVDGVKWNWRPGLVSVCSDTVDGLFVKHGDLNGLQRSRRSGPDVDRWFFHHGHLDGFERSERGLVAGCPNTVHCVLVQHGHFDSGQCCIQRDGDC